MWKSTMWRRGAGGVMEPPLQIAPDLLGAVEVRGSNTGVVRISKRRRPEIKLLPPPPVRRVVGEYGVTMMGMMSMGDGAPPESMLTTPLEIW